MKETQSVHSESTGFDNMSSERAEQINTTSADQSGSETLPSRKLDAFY